jgi:hypothetical protein
MFTTPLKFGLLAYLIAVILPKLSQQYLGFFSRTVTFFTLKIQKTVKATLKL